MRRSSLLAGAVCFAQLVTTASASAQTQPAAEPQQAETQETTSGEIVVTAQRREERLSQVPLSITAVTSEQLSRSGIVGTTDLASVTPGLQFPVNGAFAQPTIRGIGTTVTSAGSDPNVALYVDGVYMPSQAGNVFNFNNIERIEVLKGPQGTLYGRNATGGAINITTFQPSFTPVARISASYGSFDEVRLNAYASAPLTDTIAVALAALYVDDNGYSRDVVRDVPLSTYDERGVRGKILINPTDTLSITFAGDWSRKTDLSGYSLKPLNGNTAQPIAISPNPRDIALSFTPNFTTQSFGGSVVAHLAIGDYDLSSVTSLRKVDGNFVTDLDRTHVANQRASFDTQQKTFTQEVTLASGNSGTFSWVGGVFYYHDRADNMNLVTNGASGVRGRITTDAIAGFAEGTIKPFDRLSIVGGIRYSTEQRHFEASRVTGTPSTLDTSVRYHAWTPRASVRYSLSDDLNIYATYSNGFKSGTYNISAFTAVPVRPEKVDAFEIGTKFYSHGVTFSAAAFDYSYDDIQIQALQITTGLTALTNAAKAKIRGFEAQLSTPVGGGLSVDGGVAYTNGRYTTFPGALITTPRTTGCGANPNNPCGNIQSTANVSGNDMVRTPPWTFNFALNYDGAVAGGRIRASANGSYNGGFFWDVGNRLHQDPYFLLNGRISWGPEGAPWRVALWGRNLTDKVYAAYAADTTQADAVSYARPRSVGVALELAFD
jgi:iron complex outermembrane receptor protein